MEKFWPLIDSFLFAVAIAAAFFFLYWMLWAGPRRIRSAVERRLGPAEIQSCIQTSGVYWLVILLITVILTVILGVFLWIYLGRWLYEDVFQGTWQEWLAFKLNVTLWVITTTLEGIDHEFKLPIGLLLSTFIGFILGVQVGTKLGRLAAAKRFLITSVMS